MKVFALAAVSAALLLAEPPAPGKHGMDASRLAAIPERMKGFVAQESVAGTVTLVARHGEIAAFEAVGFSDIETRKPMAKDSIFQVMSMTKPMVSVGILMLADEGRLSLIDPVQKILPEFRGQMLVDKDDPSRLVKPSRPITVRDLLSHTSGMTHMPPPGLVELYQRMDRSLEEAVLVYSQLPLVFDPGTQWRYSNPGIATLGRIIEVASGKPFEQFMSERVWSPLGMKDTFIFPPEDKKQRICAVHTVKEGKLQRADGTILGGDAMRYRAGAKYSAPEFGAYSTASDLLALYEMLRNNGMHGGKRLLSKAAIDTMTAVHTGDLEAGHMPGTGFGLAWEVVKENMGTLNFLSIGTFGHGGAFGTHGWIDRSRDMVGVFLVQQTGSSGGADAKYAFMRMANAAVPE